MQNQNQTSNKFFNIHTTGIGYLNRVRFVQPKGSKNGYWACDIAALNGSTEDVKYVNFNLNAVTTIAQDVLQQFEQLSNVQGSKILVQFKIGDLSPEVFTYQKDTKYKKAGDVGIRLFGRLLSIDWVKVNGQFAWQYTAAQEQDFEPEVPAQMQPNQQSYQDPVAQAS